MNSLNSPDLKKAVINAFQEILVEDPNFFLTDRLSILTWRSKKVENALVTKVGNVRYLGMLRKDSKGQDYWKYKPLTTSEKSGGEPAIQPSSSANSPAKNEAPAQTEVKEQPAVEQSPEIKKFREKYGTINEPKINNSDS